ncbi:MAG: MFS transporter [Pseudomonadales bacterium]|nr:MFS transporter [Pseudomonadales bacterium]MBO7005531.1 MFS transporter [Pseudomonadales bacterium]
MAEPTFKDGLVLLTDRDFARLFAAYLVTYLGTAMAPIAIAFGVLDLTGSTRDSAIVIAASTTGQILILLIGGTLADRTSRHRLLVFADVIAFCSQGAIAWLLMIGEATVMNLAGLMLITGVAYALHQPSITGFIPQIVDRKKLQAANALLGVARNGAFTLGAALAGVLVANIGAGPTLALDALTFGLSGLLILSLRPKPQASTESATFFEDLRLGWREFISHKWLWTIVLQFSLIVASLEAVFGLLGPAVSREYLGGAVSWGIIAAGFGAGTILGGLLAIRLRVERPMLFASLLVLFWSITPLLLSVPMAVPIVAMGAFVAGFTGQIFGVLWYTTLQTHVPSALLSRVSAYDHLGSVGIAPLGIIASGFLYESIGFRDTLYWCAALVVVPTLLVLCVREVREIRTVR